MRGLTSERWGALALPVSEFLLRQCSLPPTAVDAPASKVFVGALSGGSAAGGQEERAAAAPELSAVVPLHTVRPSTRFDKVRGAVVETSMTCGR